MSFSNDEIFDLDNLEFLVTDVWGIVVEYYGNDVLIDPKTNVMLEQWCTDGTTITYIRGNRNDIISSLIAYYATSEEIPTNDLSNAMNYFINENSHGIYTFLAELNTHRVNTTKRDITEFVKAVVATW